MDQVLSHQHSASLPEHGRGKEGNARKVWRKEMGNKGKHNCPANGPEPPGSKALPGCGWIPAVLAGCRVKCHQCCSVDTGGIDLHSPQMRGGLCFWVAPGLTLPKAKLRHVPASIQCYLCLSVEQGRKNGIPGLSLWWGWFLDKWAVSEECLKCKDTQECWCKLEVWRAEEKSQLVPFESTLLLACNAVTTRLDKAQHLFVLCG